MILLGFQLFIRRRTKKEEDLKSPNPNQIQIILGRFLVFFILVCLSFILIYFCFYLFHNSAGFQYFLFVEPLSLVLPSLLVGFILNALLKGKKDRQKNSKDKRTKIIQTIKILGVGVLAVFLLFVDLSYYLRLDKRYLYFKDAYEAEKVIPLSSILKIKESDNLHFTIYCQDLNIKTDKLGGDIQAFIVDLKRNKKELNK